MKFAYADPPYPGHTKRGLYKKDPKCAEVDHAELVERLVREFPDGWALSTGSVNLRDVLPLCPADVRVGAWVKPFAIFKPNVNPGYCWEPVIFRGGRKLGRDVDTVRDFVSANVLIKKGCAGAKPDSVIDWIFSVLGARGGDDLVDLFPGSGAVGRRWAESFGERVGLASWAQPRDLAIAQYEQIRLQHLGQRLDVPEETPESRKLRPIACIEHGDGTCHSGAGFYVWDNDLPEEGSVGVFHTWAEAAQWARANGYRVVQKPPGEAPWHDKIPAGMSEKTIPRKYRF